MVVKDCSAGAVLQQPGQGTGKKHEDVTVIQHEDKIDSGISVSTEASSLNTPIIIFMLAGGLAILVLAILAVFGYLRRRAQ